MLGRLHRLQDLRLDFNCRFHSGGRRHSSLCRRNFRPRLPIQRATSSRPSTIMFEGGTPNNGTSNSRPTFVYFCRTSSFLASPTTPLSRNSHLLSSASKPSTSEPSMNVWTADHLWAFETPVGSCPSWPTSVGLNRVARRSYPMEQHDHLVAKKAGRLLPEPEG